MDKIRDTATSHERLFFVNVFGAFFVKDNQLFRAGTGNTMKATRAYFNVPAAAGVKTLGIVIDGDIVTGIAETVNSKSLNSKWYNLAGQRVAKPQGGIYIQNGKKVIVK